MNHYISDHEYVPDELNDTVEIGYDPKHVELLQKAGVDKKLAEHVARLFKRDPIPAYEGEFMDD